MQSLRIYFILIALLYMMLYSSMGLCTESNHAELSINLPNLQHSPSAYECAVLSAHVYQENTQPVDLVTVQDRTHNTLHELQGWSVYKLFQDPSSKKQRRKKQKQDLEGYKGVLYFNAHKNQLVLAHRGTVINAGTLRTNLFSIVQNNVQGQERLMANILRQALAIAKEKGASLTVTGHSLGGWLAQITAFIAKDNKKYYPHHIKAITFDTPGARPMLKQINPKNDAMQLDQLDITNYLSSPNLINACNPHLGTLYRVVFEEFSAELLQYNQESHAMDNFLHAFDPVTGLEKQCVFIRSWPLISKENFGRLTKGFTRLLSGQMLAAAGNILAAFKALGDHHFLGQYSGFFQFAHQTNHYHPDGFSLEEDSIDDFELKYKYHYHAIPFNPSVLYKRHIPAKVQYLIDNLCQGVVDEEIAIEQEALLAALQWDRNQAILTTQPGHDIRPSLDQLTSIALSHPALCQPAGLMDAASVMHQGKLVSNRPLPPPAIPFFVGREAVFHTISQALQAKESKTISYLIAGPGGMGKSQLAIRLFQHQSTKEYDHAFWIPAESKEKLVSAYLGIADELGIYVDKKNVEKAIQDVRVRLATKHCFYVFDDAPSSKAIRDFLPLQQGHVLITSRNSDAASWEQGINQVLLAPFEQEEVAALAQQFDCTLKLEDSATMHYLVENMSGYPLTLAQFFSFCKTQGYTPAQFVEALQSRPFTEQDQELLQLLASKPEDRVLYTKSMVQVLQASLMKLSKVAQGSKAIQLLSQLSYLDPKGIPLDWILTFTPDDTSLLKRETRGLLSLLERYSLIQWDRGTEQVYVHDVTQCIARHLHPQPSLTNLVNSLIAYVGEEEEANQNFTKWSSLLPHARRLFTRLDAKNYPQEASTLARFLTKACELNCLFREALDWAEESLAIAQERYPSQDHPDTAQSLSNIGRALWELSSLHEALRYHKQALVMRQRLYPNQVHPEVAQSLNFVGVSLDKLGRSSEASEYLEQALSMIQRLYSNQLRLELALLLLDLSYTLGKSGNLQKSLEFSNQALDILRRLYVDRKDRYVARALGYLGWILEKLERDQEALQYYKQALCMIQGLYPNQAHPDTAQFLNNLGCCLHKLGNYQEALQYYRQALCMIQGLYPNQDHPDTAQFLNNLGCCLRELGNYQEALGCYKQALEMFERLYQGEKHPYMARLLYNMGKALVRAGAYQKGLVHSQRALAMQQRLYNNEDHPHIADTLSLLGEVLEDLGKLTEAVTYYQKALCMTLRIYQQEHPHITQYLNNLISILNEIEDPLFIQQTKGEVLPLCEKYLGKDHALIQKLREVDQDVIESVSGKSNKN